MFTRISNSESFNPEVLLVGGVVAVGALVGFLAGENPIYLCLGFIACIILFWFVNSFEHAVLSALVLRSSLDFFSDQQLPAAFALGLNALVLMYVTFRLLSNRKVRTDQFWWFFAAWIGIQAMWVVLLPLGVLGMDSAVLMDSIREWVRMFSWLMVYLLVMQLEGRMPPQKVVTALFFSLIAPLSVAFIEVLNGNLRVSGTLGHYNSFGTFTLFFLSLCLWQVKRAERRWPWLLLAAVMVFFLVGSKSLTGLVMLITFGIVFFLPRFNLLNILGGVFLISLTVALFASSEFGRERLNELLMTPFFNPDMDWSYSTAIQLSNADTNSFNWRIAQWSLLLRSWQSHPILGFGLATTQDISFFGKTAHNDYIRFLVEGGIVGLISFVSFIVAQYVWLTRKARSYFSTTEQSSLCTTMLAFLASVSVGMLAGNIFVHTTLFFYWWTLFAVVGWDWTTDKAQTVHEKSDHLSKVH